VRLKIHIVQQDRFTGPKSPFLSSDLLSANLMFERQRAAQDKAAVADYLRADPELSEQHAK
jgi:hypothetical protein